MWITDISYYCDVYAVVQDIHNESIEQSINKHLSSAYYDINISFLLWETQNYLCIRRSDSKYCLPHLFLIHYKRNKPLLMNIHCELGKLEQTIHSEATLNSSKKHDNIISIQYRLCSYGASRWKLQLAEKPIEGDSPT